MRNQVFIEVSYVRVCIETPDSVPAATQLYSEPCQTSEMKCFVSR